MRQTIGKLGEKEFLRQILGQLTPAASFVNGFGNDASVIDIGLQDSDLVMKIDRAAYPIAAINGWSDYKVWGRLAVTANCSDIIATGGQPKGFMIAVMVPPEMGSEEVRDIILGAEESCEQLGVAFLGGDTKQSPTPQVVGAALGTVVKGRSISRRKANVDDLVVQIGAFGGFLGAYWGMDALPEECRDQCIEYMSYPRCQLTEMNALTETIEITSGTDLSDGFSEGLSNLLPDGAGVRIDVDSLMFHDLAKRVSKSRGPDLFNFSFGVGDWSLLVSARPSFKQIISELENSGVQLSVIGRVTSDGVLRAVDGDSEYRIGSLVNEHFRTRLEDQTDYFKRVQTSSLLTPI